MSESDDRRNELLALLLEAEGLTTSSVPDAPTRSGSARAPLSSAQARVWFEQQLAPASTAANLRAGMRIVGSFDPGRMTEACRIVSQRHEALRTTYCIGETGGAPIQIVQEELPIDVEFVDLCGNARKTASCGPDAGLEQAVAFVQQAADRPFNLAHDAAMRVAIARIGEQDHLVSVIVHHIACDDLTWEILLPDLAAAYRGDDLGATPMVQPVDFAIWERDQLQRGAFEGDLAYWRKRLSPAPTRLRLPLDRRRRQHPALDAEFVEIPFPPGLAQRISDFARARAVSPFMVLLAGLAATLSRVTGDDDIALASPTVLREMAQLEGVVGNFLNTLVFRLDLSDDPTFDDLVDVVRDSVASDLEHGGVPFDRVVEQLQPPRPPGRHPFADAMFLVYRPTTSGVRFTDADVSEVALHPGMSGFDLTVTVLEDGTSFVPGAFYRRECFDPATVRALLERYVCLLEQAIDNPERRVGILPLGTTTTPRPPATLAAPATGRRLRAQTLVEGFEESVTAYPGRLAVRAPDAELTYRELDERAEVLAAALRDAGVNAGDRVGIALPRETGLIVAVVAATKIGAAYVPVDPTQPAQRSRQIFQAARLSAVVTSADAAGVVPDGIPLVRPDAAGTGEVGRDGPAPDSVAYIIHTSGSTGEPKGVVVTHANVIRLFSSTEHLFQFSHEDVWSMVHEAAFDFSVWEMWGALLYGGTVVVVAKNLARDPEELVRLLRRERVSVLSQTPRAFALLDSAESLEPGLPDLRLVVFGGDALEAASLQNWFSRHPVMPRLVNMYGLTEATVHATYLELSPELAAMTPGSPIGYPLPDLEITLLDRQGEPVADGVVGEMYVVGPGVAQGYFDRAEMTAERFSNGRYRTGDLARRRRDGSLEFLGRADQQVKVRGYRVEPGEIEAALRRHVAEAAVVVHGDRLVAHVVGEVIDPVRLRSALSTQLPEQMLPAAFVKHDRLPLTPNGKLDSRALAAAARDAVAGGQPTPSSRSVDFDDELQRSIAAIWADALEVPSVGVDDNFFDLGGHSLLLATIRPQIEHAAGGPVPILDLYTHPSISALCAHLRGEPGMARPSTSTGADARASRQRQAIRARRPKGRE